jgi:hypothetical protein
VRNLILSASAGGGWWPAADAFRAVVKAPSEKPALSRLTRPAISVPTKGGLGVSPPRTSRSASRPSVTASGASQRRPGLGARCSRPRRHVQPAPRRTALFVALYGPALGQVARRVGSGAAGQAPLWVHVGLP